MTKLYLFIGRDYFFLPSLVARSDKRQWQWNLIFINTIFCFVARQKKAALPSARRLA
jgi:hypothetical protein